MPDPNDNDPLDELDAEPDDAELLERMAELTGQGRPKRPTIDRTLTPAELAQLYQLLGLDPSRAWVDVRLNLPALPTTEDPDHV